MGSLEIADINTIIKLQQEIARTFAKNASKLYQKSCCIIMNPRVKDFRFFYKEVVGTDLLIAIRTGLQC